MKSLYIIIFGLYAFTSCDIAFSENPKTNPSYIDSVIDVSTTESTSTLEEIKSKELKLDSSKQLYKDSIFSYSKLNENQVRLNLENGLIEMRKADSLNAGELNWETVDEVDLTPEKGYQLCVLQKPYFNDEDDFATVNLFVVINRSNGDIMYKEQNVKEWKIIPTKNLKPCDNCYSFEYKYNINFFEFAEATNDSTNEVFNLIGHNGEITGRKSWIWEKGKCKEADWK